MDNCYYNFLALCYLIKTIGLAWKIKSSLESNQYIWILLYPIESLLSENLQSNSKSQNSMSYIFRLMWPLQKICFPYIHCYTSIASIYFHRLSTRIVYISTSAISLYIFHFHFLLIIQLNCIHSIVKIDEFQFSVEVNAGSYPDIDLSWNEPCSTK